MSTFIVHFLFSIITLYSHFRYFSICRYFYFSLMLFGYFFVILGYGWPAYKGGPLFYADRIITLPVLLYRLQKLSKIFKNSDYYQVSEFLKLMVTEEISILDLQFDKNRFLINYLQNLMNKKKNFTILPKRRSFL